VSGGPEESLHRKGEILRAGTRISAAGGGVYLAKIFGPAAGATMAQTLVEVGEMLVGTLQSWEWRRINRTLQSFKDQVDERRWWALICARRSPTPMIPVLARSLSLSSKPPPVASRRKSAM
jgi:hypothetical protein